MIKIQALISLEEWEKYKNGEEAVAYNRSTQKENYIEIIFGEDELIAIEEQDGITFIIKMEQ